MENQNSKFGKPLSYYKQTIDLFEFMKSYGFSQDKKDKDKSTRRYRMISNSATGEKYVIKTNSADEFTYFTPYDTSLRGKSIIDFVQQKHGSDFHLGKVRALLDDYISKNASLSLPFVPPSINPNPNTNVLISKTSQSVSPEVLSQIYGLRPLFNTKFLCEVRHISADTLVSKPFVNRIYNSVFEIDGKAHVNTAFLFINEDNKVCGLSVRNQNAEHSYKRVFEGKQGLICSNDLSVKLNLQPASLQKPTTSLTFEPYSSPPTFIISESFIDALSHYELNQDKYSNQNVRYFSTEGTPTNFQTTLFDKLINHYKPSQINLAFDNDKAGNMFSTMLICNLSKESIQFLNNAIPVHKSTLFLPSDTVFKAELVTDFDKSVEKYHSFGQINISFFTSNMLNTSKLCANLNSTFYAFNNRHINEIGEKSMFSLTFKEISTSANVLLTFKNNKEAWSGAFDFVSGLRIENNLTLKRDKPLLSDFNEDLKLHKNKHEKYQLVEINGVKQLEFKHESTRKPNIKIE